MFIPQPFNVGKAFVVILITSSAALTQRDLPPPSRTDHYNTPCAINAIASWCAVGQVNGQFASLRIEFAHGDRPILEFVPISSKPDQWGGIPDEGTPYRPALVSKGSRLHLPD